MFPISAIVPKAFLPIVSLRPEADGNGGQDMLRPFLHTVRVATHPAKQLKCYKLLQILYLTLGLVFHSCCSTCWIP